MKQLVIRILCAVAALLAAVGATAGKAEPKHLTADSVFIKLPVDVIQVLNVSSRMDMLDYYSNDSIYRAPNLTGGEACLRRVTPSYLEAELTSVSTIQIRILPGKSGDIAAVSYTVDSTGSQADSRLYFYDADMKPLQASRLFSEPETRQFFHIERGSATSMRELLDMVPFPTVQYSLSVDDTALTARLTVGPNIDRDDYNIMRLFLVPELRYVWDGKRYKLEKKK